MVASSAACAGAARHFSIDVALESGAVIMIEFMSYSASDKEFSRRCLEKNLDRFRAEHADLKVVDSMLIHPHQLLNGDWRWQAVLVLEKV
jgi:hypothetical protein